MLRARPAGVEPSPQRSVRGDYPYSDPQAWRQLSLRVDGRLGRTVLIVSPCRSGSTALLKAFAMAGWPAVFQPIKTALRRRLSGDDTPVVLRGDAEPLFIKETLGPYCLAEAHYDPLHVLRAGLGVSELTVIVLVRAPQDCLASWMRHFVGHPLADDIPAVFDAAYAQTAAAYSVARELGLPLVVARQEDMAVPDAFFSRMASALGLPFRDSLVDWSQAVGPPGDGGYGFDKPREPDGYRLATGPLQAVKGADRFGRRHTLAPAPPTAHPSPAAEETYRWLASRPEALFG